MTGRAILRAGRARVLLAALILAAVPWVSSSAHADITYTYDSLGRLRSVSDPAGDTSVYFYDSTGNILSISRHPSSQVDIIEFDPQSGPAGTTTVTVFGTGFGVTPQDNTLTINGVSATVSSASPTQLVATVPAGATTGPIAVTVSGGGSAISSEPFTVTADGGAPTLTSFSPTIGVAGTAVTVVGVNYDPVVTANLVTFAGNGLRAAVSSATSTTLGTTVPPGATSGRIKVATPRGSAVSADDFFVPAGSYTVADVVTTARMAIGETKTISIPTAGKIAIVIFDGPAGQRVSAAFSGSIPSSAVSIYNPNGTALMTPLGMNTSNGFVDPKTLGAAGTYTLVIDPDGSYTGSVTITLYNVVDVTGSITPGGAAVPVTVTTPGQNARLTFSGTAGQRVSLRATNVTGFTTAWVSILKPDGTTLSGPLAVGAGGTLFLDAVSLPTTASYTVVVDPFAAQTGGLTLTLYDVVDVSGTITIGGAAVPVTTTVPGQNARLTFTGAAGQRVSLYLSSVSLTNSVVTLQKPDGSTLASTSVGPPTGFVDVQTLPTAGTYTVLLDPAGIYTGSMTFTLYEVPADLTGSITPGGAAVPVTIGTPGQNATLTFSGTPGQRISLRMTGVTFVRAFVSIKNPDGSTLVAPTFVGTAGAFIDTKTLGQTGTYSMFINPDIQYTGTMTLTLYDVPADATGTLTIGGGTVAVTITTPGQNGSVTFSGTASQQVTVHLTSNAVGVVTVALKKPDGSQMTASTSGAASFNLATQTLPTTSTYTVTIDPDQANTGGLAVSVTSP